MANRFAVAAGNTSSTATWSTTTGGSSGSAAPTASDDVFLDANTPGDITIDATLPARSVDCTGFAHALIRNAPLNIGTSTVPASNIALKFVNTMSTSGTGGIGFVGSFSSLVQTITWGGQLVGAVSFSDSTVTGGWVIQDTMNLTTCTVTRGIVNFNFQTVNCTTFSCTGSLTRTATLTNCTINCTGWTVSGSNFTLTLTGSTINQSSGTFAGGGQTNYATVNFTGAVSTKTVTGANTIATMSVAGFVVLPASTTTTVTTLTGPGTPNAHARVSSSTPATATTISIASGTTTTQYVDLVDVAASGGATFIAKDCNISGASSGWTAQRTYQPAAAGAGR